MSFADYKLCDVCQQKAFYDAGLNYEFEPPFTTQTPAFRLAGSPQYDSPVKVEAWGTRLGRLGDWAVICVDCAKTHKCVIVPIDAIDATTIKESDNA